MKIPLPREENIIFLLEFNVLGKKYLLILSKKDTFG